MLGLTIRQVSQQLQSCSISPVDLCAACLSRIEMTKTLNAFVTLMTKSAKMQAEESEKRYKNGSPKGPLDGIPVAVKDNFCTKGIRTTCGSNMLRNFVPTYDATMVQKLRDAGAVILGKTNLDEFAMGNGTVDSIFGPTKNVWRSGLKYTLHEESSGSIIHEGLGRHSRTNKETETDGLEDGDWFVPGGSSGGSAVATCSGSCFAALGSDTGGSTRNPASYCGVVGLKSSYGLLSRHGLIPLVNSMDVPGIFARSVDDAALLFNTLAGPDPLDSTTLQNCFQPVTLASELSLEGIHVGIPQEYHSSGLHDEVLSAWTHLTDKMEENGAKVTHVHLPHTRHSIACYSVLNPCEVASNMARYDGLRFGLRAKGMWESTEQLYAQTRSRGFGHVVRGRILAGNYFLLKSNYEKYFLQALKVRRLILEDFTKAFTKDGPQVLLTPVTNTPAYRYSHFSKKDSREHSAVEDFYTQPVNMAGLPAISIPVHLSSEGMPISVQLIGRFLDEKTLLNVAKAVECFVRFPRMELLC